MNMEKVIRPLETNEDLVEMLGKSAEWQNNTKEQLVQNPWVESAYQVKANPSDQVYKRNSFVSYLQESGIWPKSVKVHYDSDGNKTFGLPEYIPFEDLLSQCTLEDIHRAIDRSSSLAPSSKPVYKTYATQLWEYAQRMESDIAKIIPKKSHWIAVLADWFEYLEDICLRPNASPSHFQNLLEARLIFYIDLPNGKLNQLTLAHLDEEGKIIRFQNRRYPVPSSFITLAKTVLAPEEPILKRNHDQLYKFISRSFEKMGFDEKATPNRIKKALQAFYLSEGYDNKLLPRR
jgi:hypothetical protein